ncbi:transmembrane signal receptor [Lithospermum erythrorhizon]|uniref:non-specific serine/threonine protein kinase n=1 Tax=Lithospermum erythrorhizon TaxID=34254 RepID=A0AAV3PAC7_LITER
MMPEAESYRLFHVAFICLLLLIVGTNVFGDTLEIDKLVLLSLKDFLESENEINRGIYMHWQSEDLTPCNWQGISCDATQSRVVGIDLSYNKIAGNMFGNFSALTALTSLNLSKNSISGILSADLSRSESLKNINLSFNMIEGELNSTGFYSLEVLDLSFNRIHGDMQFVMSGICNSLVVANFSSNYLTGQFSSTFDQCLHLKYLDLSLNNLTGNLWPGIDRLKELSLAHNNFSGSISSSIFPQNCNLEVLDLSENAFIGQFPKEVSYCIGLVTLNLWGNNFTGAIPGELGTVMSIQALYLGSNNFSSEIPETLLGLKNLAFLDLSKNNFGGDVQEIFGRFTQVKFLLLHGNSYSGGIYTSGILNLPNIARLDLSYNNFTGQLPVKFSELSSLKFLILAFNQFTGNIPVEYGNFQSLQALDLSSNMLSGSIPRSLGNLKSLLWLMLANNSLTGEIPPELGNCRSLLWLNLERNNLSGKIPTELTKIGSNATPTFMMNRENEDITAGSGECLAMKRWIPADYPPFSFVYTLLTRKNCRSLWDRLLKGIGLFSVCVAGGRQYEISGYIQLSCNNLSGQVPHEIGNMQNFSLLHLGMNAFSGQLPSEIGSMPLIVLNVTNNKFSGEIPSEIGNIKCLQNLDLSYNNFSGTFPASLGKLNDLSEFNISYNPYISGSIPDVGQLATFEKWSFLGDPLLHLPSFVNNSTDATGNYKKEISKSSARVGSLLVFFALTLAILVCAIMTLTVCIIAKSPGTDDSKFLLRWETGQHGYISSSGSSPRWLSDPTVKVIRLDKTSFTHSDILKATGKFSEDRIIGRGGSGTVYRGLLPDGREIAVKKLQREGVESERAFLAEMEVLSGNGIHPNLVTLYGWCLDGSEKLLVYEYMGGGSLEDLITNKVAFSWRQRIDAAIDIARALVFLHHECNPSILHRDVKASNVLLDKEGSARVTDFGLARVMNDGGSHVSTVVAGTVGYVAPEYGQTWKATTKGDVYSYGVLAMELATGRRAVDGDDECLVERGKRVMGDGRDGFTRAVVTPACLLVSGVAEGCHEMSELLKIGIRCTDEYPQCRPNMKQVLSMLLGVSGSEKHLIFNSYPSS